LKLERYFRFSCNYIKLWRRFHQKFIS